MSLDICIFVIGNIPLSGLVFRSWCPATTLGTTFWVWCDLWRLHFGNSFNILQFIESDNAFDNKLVHSLSFSRKDFPNIFQILRNANKWSFSQKRLQVSGRSHTGKLIGHTGQNSNAFIVQNISKYFKYFQIFHTGQNSNAFIVQILSEIFQQQTLKQGKHWKLLEYFSHQ